jgi:hypothetical protein
MFYLNQTPVAEIPPSNLTAETPRVGSRRSRASAAAGLLVLAYRLADQSDEDSSTTNRSEEHDSDADIASESYA